MIKNHGKPRQTGNDYNQDMIFVSSNGFLFYSLKSFTDTLHEKEQGTQGFGQEMIKASHHRHDQSLFKNKRTGIRTSESQEIQVELNCILKS